MNIMYIITCIYSHEIKAIDKQVRASYKLNVTCGVKIPSRHRAGNKLLSSSVMTTTYVLLGFPLKTDVLHDANFGVNGSISS